MSFLTLFNSSLKNMNENINDDKLLEMFNKIDKKHHYNIYKLIREHNLLNKKVNDIYDFPYNSKEDDSNIRLNLIDIPNDLKNILYKYFELILKE